jgi:acetylornithine/N-succinyldiaminopimelate aminotransferase
MGFARDAVINSEQYQKHKNSICDLISAELSKISAVKPPEKSEVAQYDRIVKEVGALRGRDLFFPMVSTGAGNGPFVELADGSVKYDLITGIGVNFYGHNHIGLFRDTFDSLWTDTMQGNLGPGPEYHLLMKSLLASVGSKSRLKHAWLSTCGATANENALKIIRQKKSPASKIFAFKGCFAGRTTALQEITDSPGYRQGQPVYGEVTYLPFFDPSSGASPEDQARGAISIMKEEIARYPGKYAALEFELVQGEGGFNVAPRDFILPIIVEAKKAGLYIWDDEVQTFGRSGEIFCYQKLGLDEYIDIVTIGKMLQTAAVLFTEELNPKPGLISGTFAGASSSLAAGLWVLKDLKERMTGPQGRIAELESITKEEFARLKASSVGKYIAETTTFGGMVAFSAFRATLDDTKKLLNKMFENGAIAFYCGKGPYKVRMLPPFGVISNEQWREVFALVEKSLNDTAKELGL